MFDCKSIGCNNRSPAGRDFCDACEALRAQRDTNCPESASLSERYPQYYKNVENLDELDVYATHHLFNIQDPSGCLQHSSKKILLSGVRTGGKSKFKDIKEARDTLTRWLQLNPESKTNERNISGVD